MHTPCGLMQVHPCSHTHAYSCSCTHITWSHPIHTCTHYVFSHIPHVLTCTHPVSSHVNTRVFLHTRRCPVQRRCSQSQPSCPTGPAPRRSSCSCAGAQGAWHGAEWGLPSPSYSGSHSPSSLGCRRHPTPLQTHRPGRALGGVERGPAQRDPGLLEEHPPTGFEAAWPLCRAQSAEVGRPEGKSQGEGHGGQPAQRGGRWPGTQPTGVPSHRVPGAHQT